MADSADSVVPSSCLGTSLTSRKGYAKWRRLVAMPPPKHHGGTFRVYVIEVEPLSPDCRYVFYVGYTAGTVEKRFAQHALGGPLAAKMFRASGRRAQPLARAVRLREDLMLGTPVFTSQETAMRAEGLLARMLEARGYPTKSDTKHGPDLRRQLRLLRQQRGRRKATQT